MDMSFSEYMNDAEINDRHFNIFDSLHDSIHRYDPTHLSDFATFK